MSKPVVNIKLQEPNKDFELPAIVKDNANKTEITQEIKSSKRIGSV